MSTPTRIAVTTTALLVLTVVLLLAAGQLFWAFLALVLTAVALTGCAAAVYDNDQTQQARR